MQILTIYVHLTGTFVILTLLCYQSLAIADSHSRLTCGKCTTPWNKDNCNSVTPCAVGEVCYAVVTETSAFLFGNSVNHYYSGCMKSQECPQIEATVHNSDILYGNQKVVCGGCCENDELCNKYLCDIHQREPQAHTGNGFQCGFCAKSALSKDKCDSYVTCQHGEVCYTQVTGVVQFLMHSTPLLHYYGGCIQANKCGDVKHQILEPDGTYEYNKPICGGCCEEEECNRYLCATTTTTTTTTTPITTTTTVPTTKTTTSTTTTTTPTSTASTTHTTTTITSTTTTSGSMRCEVCEESECGESLGSPRMIHCPPNSPLCMTTINNDIQGNKTYVKGCASRIECDQKWLMGSLGKAACVEFHPNSTYNFNFNCTVCCVTDGCNLGIVPSPDTVYTG